MSVIIGIIWLSAMSYIWSELKAQQISTQETRASSIAALGSIIALTVVLQTGPVYMPIAGMALSTLSFLPLTVAASVYPNRVFAAAFASLLLISIISPEEAAIFAFLNGPLGLWTGYSLIAVGRRVRLYLMPGITLACGLAFLTWVVGFAPLGEKMLGFGELTVFSIYLIFGLAYTALLINIVPVIVNPVLNVIRIFRRH